MKYTDKETDGETHEHSGGTTDLDTKHTGNAKIRSTTTDRGKITQIVGKHLDALAVHLARATQEAHGGMTLHATSSSGGSATSQDSDSYTATQKQQGAGGSMHAKTQQSKTTTIHYAVTSKETFLRPELEAIADSGAELNDAQFPVREQDR